VVGTGHPNGEIEIRGVRQGQFVVVSGAGLPAVEVRHPGGFTPSYLPLDARTVLTVGGVAAVLSLGSGRSRADRALRIELGDRKYIYWVPEAGAQELRAGDGSSLVRKQGQRGVEGTVVRTAGESDDVDLGLALAFFGLDTTRLTLTGAVVEGVFGIFSSGKGEPG
jgi:hypothetical protein